MNAIEEGKRAIKARVQADLAGKLADLRKHHPDKNTSELWKELQASEPELIAYASRIEANNWGPAPRLSLVHAAKKLPARSKPKDDEIYVVYGSNGEVVDIEFRK